MPPRTSSFHRIILSSSVFYLCYVDVVIDAFSAQQNQHHPKQHGSSSLLRRQAKSICTFDETDFAAECGEWPYEAKDMNRLDNSVDTIFYQEPRMVTHIDDGAIDALTSYYAQELQALGKTKPDVLDLCSSWISHLPKDMEYGNVVGIGMNEKELDANPQLSSCIVQDLNVDPSLADLDDDSFDVICNVVSVDYLTQPQKVFAEMHRVLRPGGIALISFSNRCFATKAIAMWLQADDIGRLVIVASYFFYTAAWASLEALDLKEKIEAPERPTPQQLMSNPALGFAWMSNVGAVAKVNQGDPMFVVKAIK